MYPTNPSSSSLNDASVVGKLSYGDISFLLTGDVEESENEIVTNYGDFIESEILKVAHHGSSSSATPQFLKTVKPEVAVIQAGRDNRYGHPHDEVIERLESEGVKIYRTDLNRDIVITTDGQSYEVKAEQQEKTQTAQLQRDLININTASYERLQEIHRVGPVIAQRIIEYRERNGPFKRIEDIKRVSGIGPARFDRMKDQIAVK